MERALEEPLASVGAAHVLFVLNVEVAAAQAEVDAGAWVEPELRAESVSRFHDAGRHMVELGKGRGGARAVDRHRPRIGDPRRAALLAAEPERPRGLIRQPVAKLEVERLRVGTECEAEQLILVNVAVPR